MDFLDVIVWLLSMLLVVYFASKDSVCTVKAIAAIYAQGIVVKSPQLLQW
jgi:hypothetical protein